MDSRAFDELTRELIAPRSRRGLLGELRGGIVAGAVAGLGLGVLTDSDSLAKKKKKKKKKNKPECQGSSSCGAGRICVKGSCVTGAGTCPEGANVCGAAPFNDNCNGNPDCFCFQKVGGGLRCGTSVSACGTCTTTEQCAEHGTGAVCVIAPVAACECQAGEGFCIKPCPD